MDRRKLNISSRYSLGLAAVLVIFCLVVSTGVTWARYRTEVDESIHFKAREPVSVYLGKVEYGEDDTAAENAAEGKFVQTNEGSWERNEDGELQLKFAIANGSSEAEFEERNQQVYIRLVGSLGIQSEGKTISPKLKFPQEDKPEEPQQVEATAIRIAPESPMYTTFGEGWMFCFTDNEGEELTWTLEGGELNYIEMELTLEGGTLADTSLLQLQIASRHIMD